MAWVTAFFTEGFSPKTGLSPTINIYRLSDDTQVVTGAAMPAVGGGYYKYNFAAYDDAEEYVMVADGGVTLANMERYKNGGSENADNKDIFLDTDEMQGKLPVNDIADQTLLTAQIGALNNLSIADVQTALTNQGYTSVRAALLDNLDAAISSVLTAIGLLNDISIADVQTALTNQGYTVLRAANLDNLDATISSVLTAIGLLNDIDIADVQTALTNQGYTSGRALLIDNLDATISSVITAIGLLNDLSIADVQTAMDNQGYTAVRAVLLDNLDAAISAVITAIGLLNDLSIADVQTAMTAQGYTTVRAGLLDNLDAAISAVLTAIGLLNDITAADVDTLLSANHGLGSWLTYSGTPNINCPLEVEIDTEDLDVETVIESEIQVLVEVE